MVLLIFLFPVLFKVGCDKNGEKEREREIVKDPLISVYWSAYLTINNWLNRYYLNSVSIGFIHS